MQRTYYFTDQDVLQEDLNNTEDSKASAIKQRAIYGLLSSGGIYGNNPTVSASVVRGGVWANPTAYNIEANLCIIGASTTQLVMETGRALDVNGEFIQVSVAKTMNFGGSDINYSWVLPGGPYTEGAMYYVKIKYAEASGSLKANDAGVSYPTRYTDSYFVTVNGTVPVSGEILLATFTGDTSGHIKSSIKDERLYVRPLVPASGVIVDPTLRPYGTVVTAENHITAVGTGIPSPTNPHGLTGNDIGLTDTTGPHRKEAHSPAIIDLSGYYPTFSSSFTNSYKGTAHDNGLITAGITWTTPHASASIMVNGAIYHPTLDPVVFVTHPDIVAGGDGTYCFYYEGTGSVVRATLDNLDPYTGGYKRFDKFPLCSAIISSGGVDYSDFTDLRRFFSIRQDMVRADLEEFAGFGVIDPNLGTLWNNLSRIRYQLGMALNGSDWAGDNPLTTGESSIADNYHQHTGIESNIFTLNRGESTSDTSIGFKKASSTTAYFGWFPSLGGLAAINYRVGATLFYAKMIVGSLQMSNTSNILTSTHVAAMPTLSAGASSDADAYHTHNTLKQPDTAASGSYIFGTWRQNIGDSLITVIATGTYYVGQPDVYLRFYTGLTSGSAIKAAEFRMPDGFDASGNITSLMGVVPAGWYFRFTALNLGLTYNTGYGTGSLVEFYNSSVGGSMAGAPTDAPPAEGGAIPV